MGCAFRWRWLVLCRLRRCSGETRCRTGRVSCWLGVGLRPIREYEGEKFTDYYFGEANTANKSDKLQNTAVNENLNWGGFPGCYTASSTIDEGTSMNIEAFKQVSVNDITTSLTDSSDLDFDNCT